MTFGRSTLVVTIVYVCTALASAVTNIRADYPMQYLLISAADASLPPGLDELVATAGGTITLRLSDIGIAVASSADPAFSSSAASIPGVRSVVRDALVTVEPDEAVADVGNPPTSGDDDSLFDMQWALDAIDAREAWAQGFRGAGARVVVLDTGIDIDHPDLAPNLNLALSTSRVPGIPLDATAGPPSFITPAHHGTLVAGIIAAADNGLGTIGVAPEAEIVAVRVCYDNGRCPLSSILAGLVYAAAIEPDVINVSIQAVFSRRGSVDVAGNVVTAHDVAELTVAFSRAFQLTHSRGATNLVVAGNQGRNLDADADLVQMFAQVPHTITVAATAPRGWALDPATDLDVPTPYTNYGQSVVDVAAPGGYLDVNAYQHPPWALCTVVLTGPCFAFDLIVGPTVNGWSLNFGTSMAAPHVSGVAALVVGAHGGQMQPDAVEAVLEASADDLGKPGVDDFYGHGRVNAANAVRVR